MDKNDNQKIQSMVVENTINLYKTKSIRSWSNSGDSGVTIEFLRSQSLRQPGVLEVPVLTIAGGSRSKRETEEIRVKRRE